MHEEVSIPCDFPSEIIAGDSLRFRFNDSTYPRSDGWTTQLVLNGPGAQVEVEGADDPENAVAHLIVALSAATALWPAGQYSWALFAFDDADERHTVASGRVEVKADPSQVADATDQRSFARRTLSDLETHIATKSNLLSFSVFGRSYQFESWDQLLSARDRLRREIEAEEEQDRRDQGKPSGYFAAFDFGSGW